MIYIEYGFVGGARKPSDFPPISIIVPTYNSKGTIAKCIFSLKSINYSGKISIIVVDDCSDDGTSEVLKKIAHIKLIRLAKNSGSKAAVLNVGLKYVRTDFVAFVDSDTYPEKEIFLKTMGYFEGDKKVGAVSCLVLPDETSKFIKKLQFFEYAGGLGLWAALLSKINARVGFPGATIIFRTVVLKKIGGFDFDNPTEDMEMALRLHASGYKLETCFEAVALTDVPNTWKKLLIQRERWFRGRLYNLFKYKRLFFNKTNFDLGFFGLPVLFFLELMSLTLFIRLSVMFFSELFRFAMLEVNLFFTENILLNFHLGEFMITSMLLLCLFSYAVLLLYAYLGLSAAKYRFKISDLPALLFNYLVYPFILALVYLLSLLKELIGSESRWVRVSM
ncbi:MAG: glycosyltransferase family 2 protein [Candidatus Diapherotrites archaeon]|nr:glycosyltransferase family 2 protein [Candidatus Diapherotrites archaeon]